MCGRFAQQRPASELAERFAAEPLAEEPGERFNLAPTDEALVVVQREDRRAIVAASRRGVDLRSLRAEVEAQGFAGYSEVEIFSAKNWWQRDGGEVLDTCIERHRNCV